MAKRTAREMMDALVDDGLDDEMEEVLQMTPDERRAELEKAGFDLAALDAEADALRDQLGPLPSARPAAKAGALVRLRARTAGLVSLGVAAAAGLGIMAKTAMEPVLVTSANPFAEAAWLREEAHKECGTQLWKTCVQKLDEARRLDPKGDEAADVQEMRRAAREGTKP